MWKCANGRADEGNTPAYGGWTSLGCQMARARPTLVGQHDQEDVFDQDDIFDEDDIFDGDDIFDKDDQSLSLNSV